MTHLTINGNELHVQRLPAAGVPDDARRETVVFVHGMLTDSLASYYFTMAPAFAAAGVDVIMYDHRGHGKSTRIESGYELEHAIDDLAALLDEIHDGSPVHLVGNSYGGTIAYGFALEHPTRVASISAVESEPPTAGWAAKMLVNLAKAKKDLAMPGSSAWITARYGAHTARLAKSAARMLQNTRIAVEIPASRTVADDAIAGLDIPVLAIYGSESDLSLQAPLIESLVRRSKTVIAPGREHSVLVEEPRLVETTVLDWIRSHDASSRETVPSV